MEEKRFSGSDIIEIAVEIEKNGYDFYTRLTRQLRDAKAREAFAFMADEEKKHIEDFKNILGAVIKYDPCEAYPQEYFSYLNSIASEYVFTKKDELKERMANIGTDKEAIDFSLGLEKDSILFYEEMKKIVPEKDKALIDSIISQEKGHVEKLWGLRKTL